MKVNVIQNNLYKYAILVMCKVLKISRNPCYYEAKLKTNDKTLDATIIKIFKESHSTYGTRKIKVKRGYLVSRRRIGCIMKVHGLVSRYTISQFNPHIDQCNKSKTANLVKRKFKEQPHLHIVVSDLTYVYIGMSWNCICVLIDLFNREMIGYSTTSNKDASLVIKAFTSVKTNLNPIQAFHTGRGNELKNKTSDETLETFQFKSAFNMKRCPYDNAMAEATFKVIKTEFIYNERFAILGTLQYKPTDYVNWFNNHRIHSSLGYLSP